MHCNAQEKMQFDPLAPFPLLPVDSHSYFEAQVHGDQVDRWLGFRIDEIENKLAKIGCRKKARDCSGQNQNLWIGLEPKKLLTPYTELRSILEQLKPQPGSTVVDLGAAYGRMAFVIVRHFPEVNFVGYEYVGERVAEFERCFEVFAPDADRKRIKLLNNDLSSKKFSPVAADFYFIYDYGSQAAIEKTIYDLKIIARKGSITVIGRGRLCRDIVERNHPWLSQVNQPQHLGNFSIYKS